MQTPENGYVKILHEYFKELGTDELVDSVGMQTNTNSNQKEGITILPGSSKPLRSSDEIRTMMLTRLVRDLWKSPYMVSRHEGVL